MGNKQQGKEKKQKAKINVKLIFLTFLVLALILLGYFGIGFRYWTVVKDTVRKHIVENQIDKNLEACEFNGMILVAKDGKIIFSRGCGNVNGEESREIDADTVFPIFSLTKQFTGYAFLQLEKEGKVDRKDKLSKYFEDCKYGDEVTLEELLKMTSGIPEYMEDVEEDARINGMDRQDILNIILNYDLVDKGKYAYSNSNYFLIGCIIEQVTQMPYEQYIQYNVIAPSGMGSVGYDPQIAQTVGYDSANLQNTDNKEYHSSVTFSAGEICTSAINLYRWQNFLYSEDSIEDFASFSNNSEGENYNFGLVKYGDYFGHTGGGIYHRHCIQYNTATNTQVIVLSNYSHCDANAISQMVEQLLFKYYEGE